MRCPLVFHRTNKLRRIAREFNNSHSLVAWEGPRMPADGPSSPWQCNQHIRHRRSNPRKTSRGYASLPRAEMLTFLRKLFIEWRPLDIPSASRGPREAAGVRSRDSPGEVPFCPSQHAGLNGHHDARTLDHDLPICRFLSALCHAALVLHHSHGIWNPADRRGDLRLGAAEIGRSQVTGACTPIGADGSRRGGIRASARRPEAIGPCARLADGVARPAA